MIISDEALYYEYMKEGKDPALEALVERHSESLTLFLYGIVGDMEDARELMLDSFAGAVSGRACFKGDSSFKTWLYVIARNKAASFLRKKRFSFAALSEDKGDTRQEPGFLLELEEKKRILYRAIASLDEGYRQVLELIYLNDISADDAARIMKRSKKQIYNLSFRGKEALKKKLMEMGYEDEYAD